MAFCKKCGNALNREAKFCGKCGEKTTSTSVAQPAAQPAAQSMRVCHHCQATIKDTAKFCNACGKSTTIPQAATTPPKKTEITASTPPSTLPLAPPIIPAKTESSPFIPTTKPAPTTSGEIPLAKTEKLTPHAKTNAHGVKIAAGIVGVVVVILLAGGAWWWKSRQANTETSTKTDAAQKPADLNAERGQGQNKTKQKTRESSGTQNQKPDAAKQSNKKPTLDDLMK